MFSVEVCLKKFGRPAVISYHTKRSRNFGGPVDAATSPVSLDIVYGSRKLLRGGGADTHSLLSRFVSIAPMRPPTACICHIVELVQNPFGDVCDRPNALNYIVMWSAGTTLTHAYSDIGFSEQQEIKIPTDWFSVYSLRHDRMR